MGNLQSQDDVRYFLPGDDTMDSPILTRHINRDDDDFAADHYEVQRKLLRDEFNGSNNMVSVLRYVESYKIVVDVTNSPVLLQ